MIDYGVKVGQVYEPADGSNGTVTVLAVDYKRQEATVFCSVTKRNWDYDLFKLAMVRYSLKESDAEKRL
jgi:hypothetical protein